MLLALRNYQQVHSWHQADRCGCAGPVQSNSEWRPNPKISEVLPESGPGFCTYNREAGGKDQVALAETIKFVTDLGLEWEKESEVPFQVGDMSRQGGGDFPPHSAHKNGTEADLRPFRKDGEMLPTNINDPSYDRGRTRQWVKLVKKLNPQAVVLFNDPELIREGLTRYYKGHHNHLHLRVDNGLDQQQGC